MNSLLRNVSAFAVVFIAGCAPFVPMENLKTVSPQILAESANVKIYMLGVPPDTGVANIIGDVSAYSCKFMPSDPPASKGDAIKRLRLAAYKLGADAVTDVTLDERGTDALGTNCWETVHASGQAVKLKQ